MRVLSNEDVDQLNNQIHRYFILINTIKVKVYTSYQNIWVEGRWVSFVVYAALAFILIFLVLARPQALYYGRCAHSSPAFVPFRLCDTIIKP